MHIFDFLHALNQICAKEEKEDHEYKDRKNVGPLSQLEVFLSHFSMIKVDVSWVLCTLKLNLGVFYLKGHVFF